jgi:hypothetical protein
MKKNWIKRSKSRLDVGLEKLSELPLDGTVGVAPGKPVVETPLTVGISPLLRKTLLVEAFLVEFVVLDDGERCRLKLSKKTAQPEQQSS